MDVSILLLIDINETMAVHEARKVEGNKDVDFKKIQKSVEQAVKCSIESVLHDHFENTPGIQLAFATTDIDPTIDNSVRCTVYRVCDGTILLRGDKNLCKDLQQTIGPNIAKIMPTE